MDRLKSIIYLRNRVRAFRIIEKEECPLHDAELVKLYLDAYIDKYNLAKYWWMKELT